MAIVELVGDWVHDTLLMPLAMLARTYLGGSFSGGFLGYRGDLGWPRGVQEDDDVRWGWTAGTTSKPHEAEGLELSPVIGRTRRRR